MKENVRLEVGFGRVKITPTKELGFLPIQLNFNTWAESVHNDIYASATSIRDGKQTVVLISLDLRDINIAHYKEIAELIEKETGISRNNFIIATVHNHSAPDVDFISNELMDAYKNYCTQKILEAVKLSLEDFAPATAYVGRTQTPGLNFVRRYVCDDGTYVSLRPRGEGREYVGHESEADHELQTIRFEREGKKNVVLVNWQCHPAAMTPKNTINGDWVHIIREGIEEDGESYLMYLQGACGNINNLSWIAGEMKYAECAWAPDVMEKVGEALVGFIDASMKDMKQVNTYNIRTRRIVIQDTLIKDYENYERHPHIRDLTIMAFSIGDIGFAAAPFELFHQQGETIKKLSPHEMTFVCGYANGYGGYSPTSEVFSHGEYEVRVCGYGAYAGDTAAHILSEFMRELYPYK